MLLYRVRAGLVVRGQTVVDMAPVIRSDIDRIEAHRFNGVDQLQHPFDLRPAVDFQMDFAAGTHEGQRLEWLAGTNGAHDIDAGDDRAVVVGRPDRKSTRLNSSH